MVAGEKIRDRILPAFNTDEDNNNEIILTAVGNEIDETLNAKIPTIENNVLPILARGYNLDIACAGFGIERREGEKDEWLLDRLGKQIFGDKGTRSAMEQMFEGLFVKTPEIVEWIRDQSFIGKNYIGENMWVCDQTKVAFRFLVRVFSTRKMIGRKGVFVGQSYIGEHHLFDDKPEYSTPVDFLWYLISQFKMAGTEAKIEILNP